MSKARQLPDLSQAFQESIAKKKQAILELEKSLAEEQNTIDAQNAQIRQLKSRVASVKSSLYNQALDQSSLESFQSFPVVIGGVTYPYSHNYLPPTTSSRDWMENQTQYQSLNNLKFDKQQALTKLERLQTEQTNNRKKLKLLKRSLENQTNLAKSLAEKPDGFMQLLISDLKLALDDYNCKHASGQSIETRIILARLLAAIETSANDVKKNTKLAKEDTYKRLCYAIETIYQTLNQQTEVHLRAFIEALRLSILTTDIEYNDKNQITQELHQINQASVIAKENADYADYLQQLRRHFVHTQMPSLTTHAKNKPFREALRAYSISGSRMIDAIAKDKADCEKQAKPFDTKLAIITMQKSLELIDRPLNTRLQKQIKSITNQKAASESKTNLWIGAALFFAGFIVSFVGAVISFSPIVPFNLIIGCPTIACGIGLMFAGKALINSRKGYSSQLDAWNHCIFSPNTAKSLAQLNSQRKEPPHNSEKQQHAYA